MSWTDLVPKPDKLLKGSIEAPFKGREGQPWAQATARNLGHASFGDKIGNYVDQNYLGDPAPGQTGPMSAEIQAVQPNVQLQQVPQENVMAKIMQMMFKK